MGEMTTKRGMFLLGANGNGESIVKYALPSERGAGAIQRSTYIPITCTNQEKNMLFLDTVFVLELCTGS